MSRSHRLIELMQVLRRHRGVVSGLELAREAGVSLRTIYRDVATLQEMGANIEGEAGVGYILRPGFLLPPMSFTEEEIHALAAGAQWVSRQTDETLARAAQNALAKIGGVLPAEMQKALDDDAFYIGHQRKDVAELDLRLIRQAMREQRKMRILYTDQAGAPSERTIWPIMLGFVKSRRFIAGWCELREDFRLFRTDRIAKAEILSDCYLRNRRGLVKQWRSQRALARSASEKQIP
ncbi:YafY family transcriptional regulator [Pseudomonas sp. 13B_2.1_Bac1]|uniref:helix-turn-helix transcriptional regulator n=1 Tax=Pseudomonas sp. 13B_2.1_Bac1 TaxID=2971624 RepID=UPI0021C62D96|nr:YafY family protein [Pseudomonas sp. 13B_2.1_Bac1]MCU1785327.1 YafY family transcriptional regulator [Pseudomonas sp. 13B_2.1_Bac1]